MRETLTTEDIGYFKDRNLIASNIKHILNTFKVYFSLKLNDNHIVLGGPVEMASEQRPIFIANQDAPGNDIILTLLAKLLRENKLNIIIRLLQEMVCLQISRLYFLASMKRYQSGEIRRHAPSCFLLARRQSVALIVLLAISSTTRERLARI